uniref:Cytosol aminopeptidase domain-containing protein n=1 Tax=Timema poppense TaxID=170557 RepID=A0A7R9D7X9_TIMPO|nr:unnamed protein product [Timema poppensis]
MLSMARFTKLLNKTRFVQIHRLYSDTGKCLVLGVKTEGVGEGRKHVFTPTAESFNQKTGGKLNELLEPHCHIGHREVKVFDNIDPEFKHVAVVNVGTVEDGYNPSEHMDEVKENVRLGVAIGTRKLRDLGSEHILVEDFGQSECAAESATLSAWRYKDPQPKIELYGTEDEAGFNIGLVKGDAQNLARYFSSSPPNIVTPHLFAEGAQDVLCSCGLKVEIRLRDWIDGMNMRALLAVTRGSCEPPAVLEVTYCGGEENERPIVMIGKGVTYDSGGLNLSNDPKADVTGAGAIVSMMRAIAILRLPINVNCVIPLCENVPSGMCMQPGDIIMSRSGKTIMVEDTDNEGRLIVADAIDYAFNQYTPEMILSIGSFTKGFETALGSSASPVFSNTSYFWNEMHTAGAITGDRVWRLPLWKHYKHMIDDIRCADLTNSVMEYHFHEKGEPCVAGAFLKEFIPCGNWMHMDISNTSMAKDEDFPYLTKGKMTGRPTRTLIQFLYQLACKNAEKKRKREEKEIKEQ